MCRKLVLMVSLIFVLGLAGISSAALPAGWESQDIATTGGSADESNGTWTVIGDGGDIWGASDAFHYAYVPLIGDGEITAHVVDNGTGSNTWAKGGVMIRETLDANSKHVMAIITDSDGGGTALQCRPDTGSSSISFHGDVIASPPHWVRLVREGDWITGYHSDDGINWEAYTDGSPDGAMTNPIEVPMAEQIYIGLCVTSHAGGELRTYTFDNVTVGLPVIAYMPDPADGVIHPEIWANLTWKAGHTAESHDVYLGENAADVEAGTGDTFRTNLEKDITYYTIGFPPNAYPDGLVNGTTYYWRIDEVEADGVTKHKGYVWSFTIQPKSAYAPDPTDGAESLGVNAVLRWSAGYLAKIHYVFIGDDYDEVNDAVTGTPSGTTSFNPGELQLAKTYYWRVDEFTGFETVKGDVWSFTTEGAVSGADPANGAEDVKPSVILKWTAGAVAASHEVYFGADSDAVKNADKTSPEYKGSKALGEESYNPGMLTLNSSYYWRIDEVNDASPDSPWPGPVWSFTTGDFFVIDDIEDYNADDNQIWYSWHDGLGAGAPGTPGYLPGNGTGSAVGDETTPSYTEETIVHGGNQSMPVTYDNMQASSKYSEVELTLEEQRDWTKEGVANLSIWFRGNPASVGSFVEAPLGTYTMTGSGADIWAVDGVEADEFHFAYKMMTGAGSIVAKVESVENTNAWAKAGVMIRESLNPDSSHAMMVVTPAQGASFQRRPGTGATSLNTDSAGIEAPYWVKIERDLAGNFTGSISPNGSAWTVVGSENIQISGNAYIGFAVTAHNAALACEAVFTNVTYTNNVTGQWMNQDIGIASNDAEPLYVALSNSTGAPAVVVNDNPDAAQIDTWTEWVIPLSAFADQGIVLTNVDRIAIGLGTQGNTTIPGGSGKMYFDDIRLTQPEPEPEPQL